MKGIGKSVSVSRLRLAGLSRKNRHLQHFIPHPSPFIFPSLVFDAWVEPCVDEIREDVEEDDEDGGVGE